MGHPISDISEEGGVTSFAVLQLTDAHLVGSMLPLSAWDIGAVVSWRFHGGHRNLEIPWKSHGNPIEIWKSHGFLMVSEGCDD